LRTQLGEAAFSAVWNEGQAMTLEQAIDLALAEVQTTAPIENSLPLTPSPDLSRQFGGLTAREREVAALVAQGRSNRDIAAALVLSERTVASHVSNILSKLEFNSRTQIAAWAIEKGLVNPQAGGVRP
jgi:DNA-binding NarL/FixJ family response regulator